MAKHPSFPLRNPNFSATFISKIEVSLDDPHHFVNLVWSGPKAKEQKTGPFKSSPGAGMVGMDCNDEKTSRTNGSMCTPKGTRTVEGLMERLSDDEHAVHVTVFDGARGVALHFYPHVPDFAASHGCVRLKDKDVAQLIHDNVVPGVTKVIVTGTWTKPHHQWASVHHRKHPSVKK